MASKIIRVHPVKDVLIDVDIQPAFMPGGGLPVADGDGILPVLQQVHRHFNREQRFLTLDRHPPGHVSLASSYVGLPPGTVLNTVNTAGWTREGQKGSYTAPYRGLGENAGFTLGQLHVFLMYVGEQTLWPDHALVGSGEDVLHRDIDPFVYAYAQIKGTDPLCDSYSGFRDNLGQPTKLVRQIAARVPGAERVFLTGLAYDFCVARTALDARKIGYDVVVLKDATRPTATDRIALVDEYFAAKGVRVAQSSDLRSA